MKSLTLTRKQYEQIIIFAEQYEITITIESTGNQVKLNFEAPEAVEIWREELLEEV